jgi:hypothetical protein
VQKYFSNTRHIYNPQLLLVGKRFWDGLSAEEKKWTSSRGMEGSVRNPSTPGGWNGTETSPEAVHPRV